MRYLSLVVLAVLCLALPVAAQVAQEVTSGDAPLGPVSDLATYAAGLAAAGILAATKKYTGIADTAAWKYVKPVQPIVVTGLAFLAYPLIAKATGITDLPAPEIVARAPTAALVGIAAREVLSRLLKTRRV